MTADGAVDCDGGGDVDVVEDGVTVMVSGSCEDVEITSSGASVIVETSNQIGVYGSANTVDAGDARVLDIEGDGNTVTIGSVDEIDVEGDDNTITFGAGDPGIDDEGSGNTIARPDQ